MTTRLRDPAAGTLPENLCLLINQQYDAGYRWAFRKCCKHFDNMVEIQKIRNTFLKQAFAGAHRVRMRTLVCCAAFLPPGDWLLASEVRPAEKDFRRVPGLGVRCSGSRTCFGCLGNLTLAHSDNAQIFRCRQIREAIISPAHSEEDTER